MDDDDFDFLFEGENAPTNPELWSRAKSAARSKFDKYPSAYANAWASKWYKKRGGGWRKRKKKANESIELDEALKEIIMEDLRDWFKEKWKRISSSGEVKGECGSSKDTSNPDRCLPASKAYSLSKTERAATAKKKKSKSQGGRKQFVANTKKAKVKSESYLEEDTDDTLYE
jgi:hypothetical protein